MRAYVKGGMIWRGGRHVAAIDRNMLKRTLDGQRELFRGGLCFHVDVIQLAAQAGVQWIIVTERESGQRYAVRFADFLRQAWPYTHPVFGEQRGLELSKWEREQKRGEPRQLTLGEAMP